MENTSDFNAEANGFLVLDYCDIYIRKSEADFLPTTPWLDVEIPTPQGFDKNSSNRTQTNATENDGSSAENIGERTIGPCPRSSLVLDLDSTSQEAMQLNIVGENGSNGPRYDGTIRDTKCHSESGNGKQRSDAALMMGLALSSQDFGHVTIRSIKVGLYEYSTDQSQAIASASSVSAISSSTDPKANIESSCVYQRVTACLMITFWCREVTMPHLGLPNHKRERS